MSRTVEVDAVKLEGRKSHTMFGRAISGFGGEKPPPALMTDSDVKERVGKAALLMAQNSYVHKTQMAGSDRGSRQSHLASLSYEEAKAAFEISNKLNSKDIVDMTVDELWEFADANKDNKISFDEFKPLYELIHCQIMKKQQQNMIAHAEETNARFKSKLAKRFVCVLGFGLLLIIALNLASASLAVHWTAQFDFANSTDGDDHQVYVRGTSVAMQCASSDLSITQSAISGNVVIPNASALASAVTAYDELDDDEDDDDDDDDVDWETFDDLDPDRMQDELTEKGAGVDVVLSTATLTKSAEANLLALLDPDVTMDDLEKITRIRVPSKDGATVNSYVIEGVTRRMATPNLMPSDVGYSHERLLIFTSSSFGGVYLTLAKSPDGNSEFFTIITKGEAAAGIGDPTEWRMPIFDADAAAASGRRLAGRTTAGRHLADALLRDFDKFVTPAKYDGHGRKLSSNSVTTGLQCTGGSCPAGGGCVNKLNDKKCKKVDKRCEKAIDDGFLIKVDTTPTALDDSSSFVPILETLTVSDQCVGDARNANAKMCRFADWCKMNVLPCESTEWDEFTKHAWDPEDPHYGWPKRKKLCQFGGFSSAISPPNEFLGDSFYSIWVAMDAISLRNSPGEGWLSKFGQGIDPPELVPYSGALCPASVKTADGDWDNGPAGDLCPRPPPSYFPEESKYNPTLDGTTKNTKPQCTKNPDCIIRIEDCAKESNSISKQNCETYFTNVYAAGNTKEVTAKRLCQLCQFSETYASGTTGKPYTFSSKLNRVAEGSKAWPALANNCMAYADKTNGMCKAETLAAQSRSNAQSTIAATMSPYPPTSPPPAGNDFCVKYEAAGKINKMGATNKCNPSDNDGNPCCTQLANQECKFGYCLRGGGG